MEPTMTIPDLELIELDNSYTVKVIDHCYGQGDELICERKFNTLASAWSNANMRIQHIEQCMIPTTVAYIYDNINHELVGCVYHEDYPGIKFHELKGVTNG